MNPKKIQAYYNWIVSACILGDETQLKNIITMIYDEGKAEEVGNSIDIADRMIAAISGNF